MYSWPSYLRNPCLGEVLQHERDPHNMVDRYSVLCTARFFVVSLTFSTPLFAKAIACEGRLQDSNLWGQEDHSLAEK